MTSGDTCGAPVIDTRQIPALRVLRRDDFADHVATALHRHQLDEGLPPLGVQSISSSVVLFLLGPVCGADGVRQPCLILNKRSEKVPQPGDLCCPGGGVSPRVDRLLAGLLRLPGSPLTRWPCWRWWRRRRPVESRRLSTLFATALREGAEEMRLNPLGVRFLGPMPVQRLVLFRRDIYPMVCWVNRQQRFFPNWEVEKIVHIPLVHLLDTRYYARYRLRMDVPGLSEATTAVRDFPCVIHGRGTERELLWGATYRIAMDFLDIVFGFRPPGLRGLPTINGRIGNRYMTGRGR